MDKMKEWTSLPIQVLAYNGFPKKWPEQDLCWIVHNALLPPPDPPDDPLGQGTELNGTEQVFLTPLQQEVMETGNGNPLRAP